jgi:hypothetical protein
MIDFRLKIRLSTKSNKMNRFASRFVDDHVIIHINNFNYIVDTGSPLSFGRGTTILINEKNFPINNTGPGGLTSESISKLSKLDVDGLIGMDILTHFDVRFYQNEIIFSDIPIVYADTAIKLPIIDTCMGVPIITLNINNKDRRIFFDTGAKLSYLSKDLLIGTPVDQIEDFYPSIGTFKTDVYEIDIFINDKKETFRFGLLPSEIQILLQMGQTEGIIGTELLNKYSVTLSNLRKILILETHNEHSDSESSTIRPKSNLVRELSLD